MTAIVFLLVAGQFPAEALTRWFNDREERASFASVHEALLADESLAQYDRGLRSYLQRHPDLSLAEETHEALLRIPRYREAMEAFEENLIENAELRRVFYRYYDALRANPDLRTAVDDFARLHMEVASDPSIASALDSLKAHPAQGLAFLNRPLRAGLTSGALRPLRTRLRNDAAFGERLQTVLKRIDREPEAHTAVYPWWTTTSVKADGAPSAAANLERLLRSQPQWYWTWQRYQLAWANHPGARPWHLYGSGRIRRSPVVAQHYLPYRETMRDSPDIAAAVEHSYQKHFGAVSDWPPQGSPPPLAPLEAEDLRPSAPNLPRQPGLHRPESPILQRPDTSLPGRPTRPSAPDPERKTPKRPASP